MPTNTEPTPAPTPSSGAATMSAVVQHRYGGPEQLAVATVDRPTIEADQVLVEVRAAGVDRGTWHLMSGLPYAVRLAGYGMTGPKQPIPGLDVAGVVVEIGAEVTRFRPGDEVFGIADGSFAAYAAADEIKLSHKPSAVSFEHAAVAAVSGITALQALTDVGRVEAGQHVLVIGASGGVGSFAVQLAKALGAEVTGVASGAKRELVRSLGADHVIDYTTEDFATRRGTYDLIIDIGGRSPIRRLRRALTRRGTLVIVGGEGGNRFTGGVGRQVRATLLSPFVRHRMTMFVSKEHHEMIDRLAEFLADGRVVPAISDRFTLAEVPEAIRRMEQGDLRGKALVVVD